MNGRIKLKLGNAVLRLTLVFRKDHCYRTTCLPSTGIWRRFWRSWWWLGLTFKFYSSMRCSIGYMRQPWAAQGGNPKITSGFKVWRTDSKQKKFAIVDFKGRRSKKKVLTGMEYEDIPRVNRYRYFELIFDEKLTIAAPLEFMEKKILFIIFSPASVTRNMSAGFRKNMWATFIKMHWIERS